MSRLLIIDDDPRVCGVLSAFLKQIGHSSVLAHSMASGVAQAQSEPFDLVLLDLNFPEGSGLDILPLLRRTPAAPEVIIITGVGDAQAAELAFRYGAWDYIQKPFSFNEVFLPITRALQYRQEKSTNTKPVALNRMGIMGESSSILNCLEQVARAAVSEASVLITGETGTGKEMFARAIHANSRRAGNDFVAVDCGALPETLAESTLFGHEKGAFTGAQKEQPGVIVQAAGGTLFIDEIGELPIKVQASLLRTLQEKSFRPLGAKREVSVDFRVISATNRDLNHLAKKGVFREDLLFRIRAMQIHLPALRERRQDIAEIAIRKTLELGQRYGTGMKGLSPEFLEMLTRHRWPGNVRELINVLEYALAAGHDDPVLIPKHLPPHHRTSMIDFAPPAQNEVGVDTGADRKEVFPSWSDYQGRSQRQYLRMLMAQAGNSREAACKLSGISQSRLYYLLKKHGLERFRNA